MTRILTDHNGHFGGYNIHGHRYVLVVYNIVYGYNTK